MLPSTLQFLIAMIGCAINERVQRKLDYSLEEVRVLKETVDRLNGGNRLAFTVEQRRRLAAAGKELSPADRRSCCQIVKPATLLAWYRQFCGRKYDSSASRPGRPRKEKSVRELVIELARDNLTWGYTKIRDALQTGLGIAIGRTTVANILAEAGIEPAPERKKKRTWKQFMKMHWESLYACDFFSVEVLVPTGTYRCLVFFVMEINTRAVEICGIRINPDGEWMKQMARNLTDPVDGFLRGANYLIHDRDPLFTGVFTSMLKSAGVKSVKIPRKPLTGRRPVSRWHSCNLGTCRRRQRRVNDLVANGGRGRSGRRMSGNGNAAGWMRMRTRSARD